MHVRVSGKDITEHNENFQRIQDFGFHVKIEKCNFKMEEFKYLGYVINKDGIRADPTKTDAIRNMSSPEIYQHFNDYPEAINYFMKN